MGNLGKSQNQSQLGKLSLVRQPDAGKYFASRDGIAADRRGRDEANIGAVISGEPALFNVPSSCRKKTQPR